VGVFLFALSLSTTLVVQIKQSVRCESVFYGNNFSHMRKLFPRYCFEFRFAVIHDRPLLKFQRLKLLSAWLIDYRLFSEFFVLSGQRNLSERFLVRPIPLKFNVKLNLTILCVLTLTTFLVAYVLYIVIVLEIHSWIPAEQMATVLVAIGNIATVWRPCCVELVASGGLDACPCPPEKCPLSGGIWTHIW